MQRNCWLNCHFGMNTRIDTLNTDTLRFFDIFHEFKLRFAQTEAGHKRTPFHIALTILTARQIESLDAIRVLTVEGRPAAAHTLLRSIYEAYLTTLLIGFHQGSIAPDHLRRRERRNTLTKMQLARRFLRFRDHVLLQHVEYYRQDPLILPRMAARQGLSQAEANHLLRKKIHVGDRARAIYGWQPHTYEWHPFNNIRSLRDHLWPPQSNPIFSAGLFQEPYDVWLDCYFYSYRESSHHVHGSSHSLFRNINISTGQVEDTQRWDPMPLDIGLKLVSYSVEAFAEAIGVHQVWNSILLQFKQAQAWIF